MSKIPTLVTGSAGRIGRAVVRELVSRGHPVRGLDLAPTPGLSDFVTGSITDAATITRAMKGMAALVHLAATPDDDDFVSQLLPNNILGLHLILEAAREAGVKRLVLASSGQVVWWQRINGPLPIGPDVQTTPKGWYACTKMFLEAAGRVMTEVHGCSVIIARLGWCPRTREQVQEIAASEWAQNVYLSPPDAGRFFACAVEAPASIRYLITYPVSKPSVPPMYDEEPGRSIGYEPRDTWPQGVEDMLS